MRRKTSGVMKVDGIFSLLKKKTNVFSEIFEYFHFFYADPLQRL